MSLALDLLYLADLSEHARTGPAKAPRSLASFIVAEGGLQDTGREVSAVCGGARGRPCLINNRSGMPLDEAAHRAWEAGFIATASRPSIPEFLELLDDDLRHGSVTSASDSDALGDFEAAEIARDDLDRLGILAPTARKQIQIESALRHIAAGLIDNQAVQTQ